MGKDDKGAFSNLDLEWEEFYRITDGQGSRVKCLPFIHISRPPCKFFFVCGNINDRGLFRKHPFVRIKACFAGPEMLKRFRNDCRGGANKSGSASPLISSFE